MYTMVVNAVAGVCATMGTDHLAARALIDHEAEGRRFYKDIDPPRAVNEPTVEMSCLCKASEIKTCTIGTFTCVGPDMDHDCEEESVKPNSFIDKIAASATVGVSPF